MRLFRLVQAGLLVCSLVGNHVVHGSEDAMITEDQVREFLHAFERLAGEKDFSRVEELVHKDAYFRFNDGDFRGREQIRQVFEKTWAASGRVEDENFYLTDIVVLSLDENSAAATYTYNWEGRFEDRAFTITGRGTRVLVRVDGQLQIVHEHLSRFPE